MFLAWLRELEGSPVTLPRWVNEDVMGCSNVNGKGKGKICLSQSLQAWVHSLLG